jgi:hypothetical protein
MTLTSLRSVIRDTDAPGVNVNLLDDGVVNTLGLVSTMAADHGSARPNGDRGRNAGEKAS